MPVFKQQFLDEVQIYFNCKLDVLLEMAANNTKKYLKLICLAVFNKPSVWNHGNS